ncbi:MAG: associated protein [Gemmatimonadetes bacterium]|nr:associated protein [Gemmatimonadota bacterium]
MTWLEKLWKYTALGASSIVFEEANPIFGGIAARHGRAGMLGVVVAVALGSWAASIALYYVGRWRIDWVHARWPNKRRLLDGALAIVERHPWRSSLAVRFAYGLRLPLPIACGAARVPISLYAIGSGISSWLWSLGFAYLGLAFGGAAIRLLHFTHMLEVRLGFVALVLVIALFFVVRRRRVANRTARILTAENIAIMTTAEREAPSPWRRGVEKR